MNRTMADIRKIRRTFLVVALGWVMAPNGAIAVQESEPNDPISSAQSLAITTEPGQAIGGVSVEGVLGNLAGTPVSDLDFYEFSGQEGDVVTVDIDGGMGGARSVDTILGIFGPGPEYKLLRYNDDAGFPLDSGSTHPFDARIDNFSLPASGTYTVGVSSWPRHFRDGGGVTSSSLNSQSNGDYTLLISGVTPLMLYINIEIKPGHGGSAAPINPKAKGRIPVALLGSQEFNLLEVDTASLTFGRTGNEASLSRCGERELVNDDSHLDLVCHFENQLAGFYTTDAEGILRGLLKDGRAFEGRAWLKVVPHKAVYE